MSKRLPNTDLHILEAYIRVVLERCKAGACTIVEAKDDLMHPLTAMMCGGEEFIPYMKMKLDEWKNYNA